MNTFPALPPNADATDWNASASSLGRVLFTRLATHGRLRQLHLLVVLEDCGSIMRAAEQLHMSQSAATQSLAELERILGTQLFERHARGTRPTPAGRALTLAARGTLAGLLDAAESLAAIRQGAVAALRLGAIPAAAYALVSPLLGPFYGTHPDVHLELHEDTGARLLPMLTAGSLDAVFCRVPPWLPTGFVFEPLLSDEVVVVASVNHALAGQAQLPLQALAGMRWVLPAMNIQLREIFETQVLAALPDTQWFPVSTLSLPVLEGLLQQPNAVSLLPSSILAGLQASGRVCRLDVVLSATMAPLGVAYRQAQASPLLQSLLAPARHEKTETPVPPPSKMPTLGRRCVTKGRDAPPGEISPFAPS